MGLSHNYASRAVRDAGHTGRAVATSPWVAALARGGYVAKGVIYLLMGLLTVRVAVGLGGAVTDRHGALRAVSHEPFGHVLLALLTIGLAAYALWSLVRALLNPEHEEHDTGGVLTRLGYGAVAVSYAALALAAGREAMGSGSGGQSSDATSQDWTARLLAQPFGTALVILVGLIVLGIAGLLSWRAYTARFQRRLALGQLSGQARDAVILAGRCGYGALGVVFAIVGVFFIVAAVHQNPGDAKGLGGALWELT